MYDYGNARIAALRSRLLDPAVLRRLSEAESAGAFLDLLAREDDWRPVLRETALPVVDSREAVEAAIERHRSARLGALLRFYVPPARGLVEALVLPLDGERIVSIVRRRSAGELPETIGTTIVGGALLDASALGALARVPSLATLVRALARSGLLRAEDAVSIGAELETGIGHRRLEERLSVAFDRARLDRVAGRGANAAAVRAIIARERADGDAVVAELMTAGPGAASVLERSVTLARLDALAHVGRRDALGIGAVAGYVAAVEAQAIRLRVSLASVVAGWSHDLVGLYLAPSGA